MHKLLHFTMYVSFSSLFGCASTNVATNSKEFNDDLSAYRVVVDESEIPSLENPLQEEIKLELPDSSAYDIEKLSSFQEAMHAYYQKSATVPGYRLLIYSGYDRAKAFELEEELEEVFAIEATVSYEQPNYRVKIGNFLTRLDAHSLYTKMKRDFPSAIIVQDRLLKEELNKPFVPKEMEDKGE